GRELHRESRAAPGGRLERDAVVEHPRDALHDGKAEADAAGRARSLFEALEFAEDKLLLGGRYAEARIPHLDADLALVTSATHQPPAAGRVFDGVGNEVLEEPPQQSPIGSHGDRRWHETKPQSLLLRHRLELALELTQDLVETEVAHFGL